MSEDLGNRDPEVKSNRAWRLECEWLRAEVAELQASRTKNMPAYVHRAIAIENVLRKKADASPVFRAYAKAIYDEADELLRGGK